MGRLMIKISYDNETHKMHEKKQHSFRLIRNVFSFILIIFILIPFFSFAEDLVRIKEMLSKNQYNSLSAEYVQKKKLVLFDNELVIKGYMKICKPYKLLWHSETPLRQTIVLTNEIISIKDFENKKVNTFKLKDNPQIREFMPILGNFLKGDYESLEKEFSLSIISDNPMQIECIPKNGNYRDFITKVRLFIGELGYFNKILMEESKGDTLEIEFSNVVFNPVIQDSEFELK
ncbi:MAG: outer membrane lipoprotein carrier protein LolA [uncultured bacterium]|nr:MAG: outer membrane lipoprotein carrier protein LolA [uncultured bacterium]